MFGHLFASRRSTASPAPVFKTGPSTEKATAKLPSNFTKKLQALREALKPRRSGTKGFGPATSGANQETPEPTTSSYQKSGHFARRARSILSRRREDLSSSTTSGLLPAGTTPPTRSTPPHSGFPGPLNAPPTPLGPIVQAASRVSPRLQGLTLPSDPEANYPPARKRVRELRAMNANLVAPEVRGIQTTRAYHVEVVAPRTTTTFPPPRWEVTALEYADSKPTPATKLQETGIRVHEERNLLNAGVYQARRCASHENPIRTPGPDPSRWIGDILHNDPDRNQKPVRNRSPLLDSATVPAGQELYERLTRSRNLGSSRH